MALDYLWLRVQGVQLQACASQSFGLGLRFYILVSSKMLFMSVSMAFSSACLRRPGTFTESDHLGGDVDMLPACKISYKGRKKSTL